ncbi:MAG: CDP-alcohol phosphatidyltransferase family protein, partial [Bacteroidota bacterium]
MTIQSSDANRFFTISNLLSISRGLLAIPFMMVMLVPSPPSRPWAAAIMILAAITDKLDGAFARKFHQATEWGKILDPIADKVAVASVVISLLVLKEIPLWFVSVVLGRDILIFLGGMYVKAKKNIVLSS